MQITLDTSTAGTDELTALIALLASLGGRLPNHSTVTNQINITDEDRRSSEYAEINQGRRGPPLGTVGEMCKTTPDEPAHSGVVHGEDVPVDSKGTPWDARIHSESKATVADGTWRKRRGVDEAIFASVMAELTGSDEEAPPPPPAPEEPAAPLAPADEPVPAPPAPTEAAPSEPAPAASAPVAGSGGQFASFAEFVAAVAKHGKTYVELNEMAGALGVPAFKDLKDHADQWDVFFAMIG